MLQPIFIPAVEFLRRPCQECLFFIYFGCRRVRERKRLPGIFMHTTASQARTPWKPRLLQNWVFLPLDQSLCLGGREAGWRWVSQCPIHLHSQPDPPHLPHSQIFCPVRPGATSAWSTFVVSAPSTVSGPQRVCKCRSTGNQMPRSGYIRKCLGSGLNSVPYP